MLKTPDRPVFSPKKIAEITKYMEDKIELVYKLQEKGILPYCKPAPKYIVEISDIMRITGKCERTAQRRMKKIREQLNKMNGEDISVDEFIEKSNLPAKTVLRAMNMIPDRWPEGY